MPCDRDLERRLADINQKVVEAERKLREAESSSPDLSSSEKVRLPVDCAGRCVFFNDTFAIHAVTLHRDVLPQVPTRLAGCRDQASWALLRGQSQSQELSGWMWAARPPLGCQTARDIWPRLVRHLARVLQPMPKHSDAPWHLLQCTSPGPVTDASLAGQYTPLKNSTTRPSVHQGI